MNIHHLEKFVKGFQNPDGSIAVNNPIKATAEYVMVHRFCPALHIGDTQKAQMYLLDQLPVFAFHDVTKGFHSMEEIWQIAVGVPEETVFLSEKFLKLCKSLDVSVVSSLLLVLLLQKVKCIQNILEEVIAYQKKLFDTVSVDTVYETTHNVMTFYAALPKYNVQYIISESCSWLLDHGVEVQKCVDILAETAGVLQMCKYNADTLLSVLELNQNKDGGYPIFAGGKSAFHSSLVALWAFSY
jgi:hypothetical protein